MTRNGKIARLPLTVREELNQRIQNGEQGKQLVDWLNALPQVQAVMQAEFEGRPVGESNLSEWKNGGYPDWEADQHTCAVVRSLVESAHGLQQAAKTGLTETLGLFLTAKMAVELRRLDSIPDGEEKTKAWRELRSGLLSLRRGELNGEKLRLEREKFAQRLRRDREENRLHRKESREKPMTPEEKEERIRQIMGTD